MKYHMIYLVKMFRLCSECSDSVENLQSMFRMFGICSDTVQNGQTFQTMVRLCSVNVQNVPNLFRMFSQCSDFFRISTTKTGLFRISWLCSVYSLSRAFALDDFLKLSRKSVVKYFKTVRRAWRYQRGNQNP